MYAEFKEKADAFMAKHPRISRYKFHTLVIAFFFVEMLVYLCAPFTVMNYNATSYLLNYDMGFGPRLLIGSVLFVIVPYITYEEVYIFVLFFTILLTVFAGFLIGEVMHRASAKSKTGTYFIAILYLTSPAVIAYLYNFNNFGRLDLFLLILALVMIPIIYKREKAFFLIPILCGICMLIHESFIFLFFPAIALVLLYMHLTTEKKKWLYTLIVSVVVCGTLFLYLNSLSLNFDSTSDVIIAISLFSNIIPNYDMIDGMYFMTVGEVIQSMVIPGLLRRVCIGILTVIMFSPVFYILIKFWRDCRATSEGKMKMFYTLCMLAPLAALPLFILAIDWGRWFAAFMVVQFIMIFFLLYAKDKIATDVVTSWEPWVLSNKRMFAILMIYLLMMGPFLEELPHVATFIWDSLVKLVVGVIP
jgi:hypothetical protein